jgi:hypothetical protein
VRPHNLGFGAFALGLDIALMVASQASCSGCSGVTVLLQWCYSGVTVMSQGCYSGVTCMAGPPMWSVSILSCLRTRKATSISAHGRQISAHGRQIRQVVPVHCCGRQRQSISAHGWQIGQAVSVQMEDR